MWPSGYYIRPKGMPQVSPFMKIKEFRNHDEWEIKKQLGSTFWNELHVNSEWMVFVTPSNNIIEDAMEIGLHGWQVTVIIRPIEMEYEESGENHLSVALANESFEDFGKAKMTRYEFDVEFRLDHTELQLWLRWTKNIRTHTTAREVNNYPNWGARSYPGGPVWEEFKITNEEMHFMTPFDEYMKG